MTTTHEPELRLPHGNTHADYPLYQPMLGEVIADYSRLREIPESDITVLKVEEGYGRHTHDRECYMRETFNKETNRYEMVYRPTWPCMRDCDDSDWIVTLEYRMGPNRLGWPEDHRAQAVYGIKDGKVSLWMD